AGGHRDFADELGEERALARAHRFLLALDLRPPVVARHACSLVLRPGRVTQSTAACPGFRPPFRRSTPPRRPAAPTRRAGCSRRPHMAVTTREIPTARQPAAPAGTAACRCRRAPGRATAGLPRAGPAYRPAAGTARHRTTRRRPTRGSPAREAIAAE